MKAKSTEQEVDAFSFEILIGSRFLDYSHRVEILRLASTEEPLQAKALSQLKHPAVFLFRSHVSVHWQSHEAYICVAACILPIFPLLPPCLLGGLVGAVHPLQADYSCVTHMAPGRHPYGRPKVMADQCTARHLLCTMMKCSSLKSFRITSEQSER